MYLVRTTSGFAATACTLDIALTKMGQHLAGCRLPGVIQWNIATYGDRSWSGVIHVPPVNREQAIGEQLDHINARLVLAHLAGAEDFLTASRLHTPVGASGTTTEATQRSFH